MSSRALRKLQGQGDIVVPELLAGNDSGSAEEDEAPQMVSSGKKKTRSAIVNPFDMLIEDTNTSTREESDGDEDKLQAQSEESVPTEETNKVKKKRKKKKKKKYNREDAAQTTQAGEFANGDEIDMVENRNEPPEEHPRMATVSMETRELLAIESKNLSADNEMRRIFGSRVVQAEQSRANRRRGRVTHRSTLLTRPKDTWPHMGKSGLSMSVIENASGPQIFTFEHNSSYQKVQSLFWEAVQSLDPQNIVSVLNSYPYHVDSLLQLSEVCRMSEDPQMATELIERAIYVCECSFHPLFNISSGNCLLEFRRQENRAFFVALFRHILFVGQRGCYRTALEFCKVLLRLDPKGDPLGVLLMVDFYALKSSQFDFLIRLFHEWEAYSNLSQLPNFAFSVPLSMFHKATAEGADTAAASDMLQTALLMFPGVLMPLLDKCGVAPNPQVENHPYWKTSQRPGEPDALNQLSMLYVGRCAPCWKEPEVLSWLEASVKEVLTLVDNGDKRVTEFAEKRTQRYRGTPRNIYRHIILSEIKDATATLPPELSTAPILSYDPLPPTDAITSYAQPTRRRVVEQDDNALSMFFRSLLPNFNIDQAVEDEPEGARGGQGLRQGVGALMDAMRDLLNNLTPVEPPREDDQNDELEEID